MGAAETVAVDGPDVTVALFGSLPDAVAELVIAALSISAWVTVYDAVQVIAADAPVPAAVRFVRGQVTSRAGPAGAVRVSATVTALRPVLPVSVTRNE